MIVFKDIDEAPAKPKSPGKTGVQDVKTAELPPQIDPEARIDEEPDTKTQRPRGRSKVKAAKK